MSESGTTQAIGSIAWVDLTGEHADELRDFYKEVVGWKTSNVSMGGYDDYCMLEPSTERTVAGVCHARGTNAGLPNTWLIYIMVENLDESVRSCLELGGSIVAGPKDMGDQGRYCVIRDPSGAPAALYQAARKGDSAQADPMIPRQPNQDLVD